MEVTGSSVVNVYQDGTLVLSDNTVFSYGSGARVFWGDASVLAGGRSEWTYVATNLAAVSDPGTGGNVPLPGTLALAGLGLLALGARRRGARRKA